MTCKADNSSLGHCWWHSSQTYHLMGVGPPWAVPASMILAYPGHPAPIRRPATLGSKQPPKKKDSRSGRARSTAEWDLEEKGIRTRRVGHLLRGAACNLGTGR